MRFHLMRTRRQKNPGHRISEENFTKDSSKKRSQRDGELICLKNDGLTGYAIPREMQTSREGLNQAEHTTSLQDSVNVWTIIYR